MAQSKEEVLKIFAEIADFIIIRENKRVSQLQQRQQQQKRRQLLSVEKTGAYYSLFCAFLWFFPRRMF
jgi:hypothetical protein